MNFPFDDTVFISLIWWNHQPFLLTAGSQPWKIGAPDDEHSLQLRTVPRPWKKSFDWRKLHGALVIPARCLHQRSFLQYIARRGMGRGAWEGFKQSCGCQQKWYKTWNKTGWNRKNMFLFFCLPNLASKLPHTKRIWQRIRSCWEKIGPQIVLFFWWNVPSKRDSSVWVFPGFAWRIIPLSISGFYQPWWSFPSPKDLTLWNPWP